MVRLVSVTTLCVNHPVSAGQQSNSTYYMSRVSEYLSNPCSYVGAEVERQMVWSTIRLSADIQTAVVTDQSLSLQSGQFADWVG